MHEEAPPEHRANPGYAFGQLARALATAESHEDAETRARAAQKSESWRRILDGMLSGALSVGSRTPVADTPAWATLQVTAGGFATGQLLAEGPLLPHERDLLQHLGPVEAGAERSALNGYFLSDEGLRTLHEMLESGCYRLQVPEEGALPAVAWLMEHGETEAVRAVLDELSPFFHRLRFYPVPDPLPLTAGSVVRLWTVGETATALQCLRVPPDIAREKEAINVWTPLYDQMVGLFLETVDGEPPSILTDAAGKPSRNQRSGFYLEGGWPCQQYPEGWAGRAGAVMDVYQRMRVRHPLCTKPDKPGTNFAILRGALETCIRDPRALTGREVGRVRGVLAGTAFRMGLPGSARHAEIRKRQARQGASPTTVQFARVLAERLRKLPQDGGLATPEAVLQPVNADEAERNGLREGQPMSRYLGRRLRLCLEGSVETLVEKGVIRSGETLATVIPQITAQVRSAGIADSALRRLYGAVYTAFRKRRSLLLLNLQSQVKLDELPWLRAIQAFRQEGLAEREQARQTLEQVTVLALAAFPHQILPNKLLQEIRSLAEGAGLKLPIVDELAADIFQGALTEKFLRAAQKAAELLEGSLYERYYGVPYEAVLRIDDVKPSQYGPQTSPELIRLCTERAADKAPQQNWSVARNGKIIEQVQIFTTQNLAVLFDAMGLSERLGPRLPEMARHCFEWICARHQMKIAVWKSRLRMVKNTAYAWRQMLFYLSLVTDEEVELFLAWAIQHLAAQKPALRQRFRPVLEGLVLAEHGGSLDDAKHAGMSNEVRRFLGWTTERHWLLAPEAAQDGPRKPA